VIRKWIFGIKVFIFAGALLAVAAMLAWFYPGKIPLRGQRQGISHVIIVLGGGSHERPLRAAQLFNSTPLLTSFYRCRR